MSLSASDHDPEPEVQVSLDLDEDLIEFLDARATRAGRSLQDQLSYELKLNRGLAVPDPWDQEGRERGAVFRLFLSGSPSRLRRPLLG